MPIKGRCAEHPAIHERADDCRRFMTLAFAIDLGLEPPCTCVWHCTGKVAPECPQCGSRE